MLDKLKNCSLFVQHSPKRNNLLQHIVNNKFKDHPTKRKALLQLYNTHWAERHNAYQHFYQAYTFIVEALEMIGHGQHIEEHGSLFSDWDAVNRMQCSTADTHQHHHFQVILHGFLAGLPVPLPPVWYI